MKPKPEEQQLIRGIGLGSAVTLNMIDMIGVGPFITMPLIIAAMGGPQAMLGWIVGALLVMCDGLVWAELGAMMPNAGGPYRYLQEIYGPRWGRLISFLFIWQLTFSAPLSMASGCIGFANYASYLSPVVSHQFFGPKVFSATFPLLGTFSLQISITVATLLAMGTVALAVILLYRRITIVGKLSSLLWVGVMITIAWIIFAGVTHFDPRLAFSFPPGAFTLDRKFFTGLSAAMLISVYDYWGYYNVCFLGAEIKDPGRTIPRAIILSIIAVAILYIVMNISILGVMPWQDIVGTAESVEARKYIISTFMQRLYGHTGGVIATLLIMWTAFASVFSLLLGYSRVPYAAATDGNYFKIFGRVHPRHKFPVVSLLAMGCVAAFFCLFTLQDVVTALVVIRLLIQFIAQIVGVIVLRVTQPDRPRPFRMWLYPLPAVLALTGFMYVLFGRKAFYHELRYALLLLIVGVIIFVVRAKRTHSWPFGVIQPAGPSTAG